MYAVSSAYMEAIAQPVREFKIAVTFNYADGTQTTFDDHDIATDSDVVIESQAVSGSAFGNTIDIGAVPTATASLAILEDDTNLHRYAGAEFNISVSLRLEDGEYEPVNMGTFYVDSSKTSRIGTKIEVFGYDAMPSLMYDISSLKAELKGLTAYSAVRKMVNARGVKCNFTQSLSGFPNSSLPLDFSSTQIETARDAIMWIAQLMGCFAHINRDNELEFVPIKSNWEYYSDEQTSGTILAERTIYGAERYETKFSDDRLHICGISMLGKDGKTEIYKRTELESDSNVIINLEQNPLIISSETSTSTILNAILDQLSTAYFYAFTSEIINDPALDAGDTIRLKGGRINGTNRNEDLFGFITHNTWRYRGRQTVVNTGHIAIGYDGTSSNIVPASSQSVKAVQENINKIVSTTPSGSGSANQADRDRLIATNGDILKFVNNSAVSHSLNISNSEGILKTVLTIGQAFLYMLNYKGNGSNIKFGVGENDTIIQIVDSSTNGAEFRVNHQLGKVFIEYSSKQHPQLRRLILGEDYIQYVVKGPDRTDKVRIYRVPLELISES